MEENLFPEQPTHKLFSENAIRIATFLGGPLVAGYLFAENYKQLGERKNVQTSWLVAIAATVAVFLIAYILPERFPPYIIPIAYTVATYELAKKVFGEKIKTHKAAGGLTWPMGRAVVAGIIGLAIIVAVVFAFFFFSDQSLSRS